MIKEISIDNGGFISPVILSGNIEPINNWITVLIGENGSKKSFLLRAITEAALGRRRYRPGRSASAVSLDLNEQEIPRKIIAISGTPLDRFPRTGTTNIGGRGKNSRGNIFVYLGQRAANGMAGVAQCERSLVGSLLSNRQNIKNRAKILDTIFSQLGLQTFIAVRLRLANSRDNSIVSLIEKGTLANFRDELIEGLNKLANDFEFDGQEIGLKISDIKLFILKFSRLSEVKRVREVLASYSSAAIAIRISAKQIASKSGTITVSEWEALIRIGVVEIDGTLFRNKDSTDRRDSDRNRIDGEKLSSGQWSWLSQFVGLTVELRDETLILVDEPENSLHPAWQKDFIPNIVKIIENFNKCQVVVATHSPLIASGVSIQTGNVRTLKKVFDDEGFGFVESIPELITYGWTANDVYEENFNVSSTRSIIFTKIANSALKIIKNGLVNDEDDVDDIIFKINIGLEGLPKIDPMREILLNIVARLKKLKIATKDI